MFRSKRCRVLFCFFCLFFVFLLMGYIVVSLGPVLTPHMLFLNCLFSLQEIRTKAFPKGSRIKMFHQNLIYKWFKKSLIKQLKLETIVNEIYQFTKNKKKWKRRNALSVFDSSCLNITAEREVWINPLQDKCVDRTSVYMVLLLDAHHLLHVNIVFNWKNSDKSFIKS